MQQGGIIRRTIGIWLYTLYVPLRFSWASMGRTAIHRNPHANPNQQSPGSGGVPEGRGAGPGGRRSHVQRLQGLAGGGWGTPGESLPQKLS